MQSVEAPVAPSRGIPAPAADPFARERFFLRQKHFSLQEKYFVRGENEEKLLFVERPRHHLRSILALLAAFASFLVVATLSVFVSGLLVDGLGLSNDAKAVAAIVSLLLGAGAALTTAVVLSAKRHVSFYRDENRGAPLLRVEQDSKVQVLRVTYTVKDAAGAVLARLAKHNLYDVFRKRWYCHGADGALLCVVKEDSPLRAFARRVLGPLFGLLRTNFVFLRDEREIGRFDRQLTLFDRYVLDVSSDAERALDRRVALAIGVMLDTGERR